MRNRINYYIFFPLLFIALQSCSVTKYLKEGQSLYTGAKIKVKNQEDTLKVSNKKEIEGELEELLPKSGGFLGLYPREWFYLSTKEPKKKGKGLRHFLKYKIGRPPVLFEDVDAEATEGLLTNRLVNEGYFGAEVSSEVVNKGKKKNGLKFLAEVSKPYRYAKIIFPEGDNIIAKEIQETKEESLLKPGKQYSLAQIKAERERVETALADKGYFYFSPDYLLFKADSTIGNRLVEMRLSVKPNLPAKATRKYKIGDIYVYPYYSIGSDTGIRGKDTLDFDGLHFINHDEMLKPKVLKSAIFVEKGEYYSREDYQLTLNRLMNLGVYKFVNVEFKETADTANVLNVFIYLTPMKKKSIRVRAQGVTQSNNMAGPELMLNFRNRNVFNGAEVGDLDLHSSYEFFIGDTARGRNLNSYEYGGKISLQVPKFIAPFKVTNVSSLFVPHTVISLAYNRLQRLSFFTLSNAEYRFGYAWQESIRKRHELYPVSINYINLHKPSIEFSKMLDDDPYLKRNYEDQLIPGASYIYTYNSQAGEDRKNKNDLYFQGTADIAGNLAFLLMSLIEDTKPSLDTPYAIKGVPFAQFLRLSGDVRRYWDILRTDELVGRVVIGTGIPYGNSYTMPFLKQFYVGGSNSIRAFQPRTLGPGTYFDSARTNFYIGQGGDIKIESNLEYRFGIAGPLKGAVFTDAGNIWLFNEQEDKPGGHFRFGDFYKEFAVGTGAGIRLDIKFFVLRLDAGYPLRKPYLPEGDRWINPGSQYYQLKDIVFNLAIGYPF